jgi:hypothetical protein
MRRAVTPISYLFAVPRRDNDLVAAGAGRHDWKIFCGMSLIWWPEFHNPADAADWSRTA